MTDECPKCATGKLERVRDISTGYEDHLRCWCGWLLVIPADPGGRLEAAELLEQMQAEKKVLHKAVHEETDTVPPPSVEALKKEKIMPPSPRKVCPTCKRPDVTMSTKDMCGRCYSRQKLGMDPVTGEKLAGGGVQQQPEKTPAKAAQTPTVPAATNDTTKAPVKSEGMAKLFSRDVELARRLQESADFNRRSLENEILFRLDRSFDGNRMLESIKAMAEA